MAEGWTSVHVDSIEPIAVVHDSLLWRPLRRELDVGAFGINAYVAREAGDDVVEEHDESTLGHEEIYLVLSGRASFTLDGESFEATAGTLVFVRDPAVVRRARAEEPNTQVLAIGGPRRGIYEPSAWEDFFAAMRHRNAGDYDAYLAELEEALERRPDHPAALFHVARAEVLVGRLDDAVRHLKRALELRPEWSELAATDDDLAALRERPDWPVSSA